MVRLWIQRAALIISALGALSLFPNLALAQSLPPNIPAPPVRAQVDPNNVDLTTGNLEFSAPELSIGSPGEGGLAHVRFWTGAGWRHEFVLSVTTTSTGVRVNIGSSSVTFTLSGGVYTADQASGATLTATTLTFTYTASDGTVITFDRNITAGGQAIYYEKVAGVGTSMALPNGEVITLTYYLGYLNGMFTGPSFYFIRLQSVNTNTGYQLKYTYASNTLQSVPDIGGWIGLVKVTAINNVVDYCNPIADSCTALTQTWPSVSYSSVAAGSTSQSSVTDPIGRVTRYTNNSSSGRILGIKRPSSTVDNITIGYDANGRVSSVSNGSASWGYGWTLSGTTLTATVTDPLAHTRVVTANTSQGVILTDKDGLNRTTSYGYDGAWRLTKVTAPEGNYVQYGYDARGNITSTTAVSKTPGTPVNIVVSAGYDATCANLKTCNQPNWTKDALGNQTDFTYDPTHGGVLTMTAPAPILGGVRPQTRSSYTALYAYYKNSSGTIVAAATPVYKRTAVSQCATSASCAGSGDELKLSVGYGPQVAGTGNNLLPISRISGSGDGVLTATTAVTYDILGNLTAADGPLLGPADTSRFFYDAARQATELVGPDPDGAGPLKNRAVQLNYNLDGRTTTASRGTANADGSGFVGLQQAVTAYDTIGRKISDTSSSGGVTYAVMQYSYDAANRLDCTAQRMNPSAFGSLPAACTLGSSGSFGPDRITKNGYDAANQLTSVITGYGTSVQRTDTTMAYSNNGKMQTIADGKGNLTTYVYDGFDRLSKTLFPSPTIPGTSSTVDYEQLTYNAASQVAQRRLRDGLTIAFGYDNIGRLSLKDLPGSEPDVTYSYDNLGRRVGASQTGNTVSFGWDALGRNISQSGPLGTASYQYDLAGRRTRLTWPDGFYVNYDMLVTGEVAAIRENGATSGVGILASYNYDDLGQRTLLTRGNGTTTSYGYDAISRLTSLSHDLAGTTADQALAFSNYSPAGQIGSRTASNSAYAWNGHYNVNRTYSANGLNQYTQSGAVNPTYDARGNLTSAGAGSYTYSSENLLLSAPSASLAYDPLLRLYRIANSTTTSFGYDGENRIVEYSGGTIARRYVYGPNDDELLVWYEGATTNSRRFIHSDERGSVIALSDSSGALFAINSYDEYGIPATANQGRAQYTGQMWEPSLGLYYYKARFYSPTMGRFLQPDAIGYGDGMNWYNYAHSDPVDFTDPTGLDVFCGPGFEVIPINNSSVAPASDTEILVLAPVYHCTSDPNYHADGYPPNLDLPTPTTVSQNVSLNQLPPNWRPPTHPPARPPSRVPNGLRLRISPARPGYPDGYWQYEKPMANGGWQGIDPSTMKPGPEPDVHVPLPYGSPYPVQPEIYGPGEFVPAPGMIFPENPEFPDIEFPEILL